jgi:hypothetical protein
MQIVRDGGTYVHKLNEIKEFVWERFKNARESGAPVHDLDLKRWSLIKTRELQVYFKASQSFIDRLKIKYGISSRKKVKKQLF